ncbi:DUF429 domain-containing protein [Natronobacterium texcoconense]|uniref:Predicted nuclease (RNAse H fold) n=1 Tax=Natronobacterium texcoconense TaxID=1095778 RepID=A0A1H1AL10_NATTX|nr:DUF429 domain-containing protein [Natronobacterium texcoconense]SDQ40312.1 Predicted nuclease (RNAse H fold) [Natronobacterium texcoconense]
MAKQHSIGIDWCNDTWLAVVYQNGEYEDVLMADDVVDVYRTYENSVQRILIDVPIGLFQEGDREGDEELVRQCDKLARQVLGSRHSSVFNPPAREAAEEAVAEEPHEKVTRTNKRITGKGLQQQAYHIAKGVFEVDKLLQDDQSPSVDGIDDTIAEAHPEVCFRALAGEELKHSKKLVSGFVERLEAMREVENESEQTFYEVCNDISAKEDTDVEIDDVLDAMVLAITAAADEAELLRLPSGNPPSDSTGLPMEMVYRAREPLLEDQK